MRAIITLLALALAGCTPSASPDHTYREAFILPDGRTGVKDVVR